MTRLALSFAALLLAAACGGTPEVVSGEDGEGGTGGTAGVSTGGSGAAPPVNIGGTAGAPEPDPEAVCGNAELEIGEICDDGNTDDGDGCSADCLDQDPNYDCSTVGEPCINQVICGNGRLEGLEACDDGNTDDGDGCSADCATVEDGFVCPRPDRACIALPICGNSVRERGEQCDDGQVTPEDGDGCSAACQLEDGFFCRVPGEPCVLLACGDGMLTPDETCDDGQSPPANGDGCSSDCEVEPGFRCSGTTCAAICGDGLVRAPEQCDDQNRTSGDGCSAACRREPFTNCTGQPSVCTSTIRCGNGQREPGEICDPPGTDGCLPGCQSFSPDVGGGAVCGNNRIEAGEECDFQGPASIAGCTSGCTVVDGWSCPFAGVCFELPRCGDGVVNTGEACDDGNNVATDGCNSPPAGTSAANACRIQAGWSCVGIEPSVCRQQICGNGILTPDEQCDDGDTQNGDGCSSTCRVTSGWVCPVAGDDCFARCGDGIIAGDEDCDDRDTDNGDGCNSGCRQEPGFVCATAGAPCVPAQCPNDDVEPGEGCDDGNLVAGDGCGPTCQLEPVITRGPSPTVQVFCGDGLLTSGEACDDGNTTSGDGCSSACAEEAGFTCTESVDLPGSIEMQVTYRDMKSGNALTAGGHPDFQYQHLSHVAGIAGARCNSGNATTCGRLDAQGKPPLVFDNRATTGIRGANTFGLWFRDSNPTNVMNNGSPIQIQPLTRTLTLTQQAAGSDVYGFASTEFFPLGTDGFGSIGSEVTLCNNNTPMNAADDGVTNVTGSPACDGCIGQCLTRNFGFTTELRYFFQYRGGETLSFFGDDDVWVYVNGRLAVDLGGLHSQLFSRVVLGDDGVPSGGDSDCTPNTPPTNAPTNFDPATCYTAAESGNNQDSRFGLTEGNVYEIVLFHAERHTSASRFRLTLSGFLAPRSFCTPICGDGVVVAGEACDDGDDNEDGVSGACNTTCTSRAFCGDGVRQTGEVCDNGTNLDLYVSSTSATLCAPGCVRPPRCGDGTLQVAFEQCDRGSANTNAAYGPGQCRTNCTLGGYCGDGTVNGTEVCDQGAANGTTYGLTSCGYDCRPGPRCGDGQRNGAEECDGTPNCNAACRLVPFCGDGVESGTEECDHGQFASDEYGGCTDMCTSGPGCGDANVDTPFEECDLGSALNNGAYDGCSMTCTFGPRCGDAVLQSAAGEACDNGINNDTYALSVGACGPLCTPVPFCGDGDLQSSYEFCDEGQANADDSYDGCTTSCEFGPYCGDGTVNGQESCDEGADNRAYSPDGVGCGYDCEPSPYCGDGERNGPEQCDLGAADNTGEYGTCNENCTLAPRCGDMVTQASAGEQCDDGPTGSTRCTSQCVRREVR